MLEKIAFSEEDHLFLLGDLFDRNSYEPDPIGIYFNICVIETGRTDYKSEEIPYERNI